MMVGLFFYRTVDGLERVPDWGIRLWLDLAKLTQSRAFRFFMALPPLGYVGVVTLLERP